MSSELYSTLSDQVWQWLVWCGSCFNAEKGGNDGFGAVRMGEKGVMKGAGIIRGIAE